TNSGPIARIVYVPQEAIPDEQPELHDFVGVLVGIEDQPRTVNSKEVQALIAGGRAFPADRIDPVSRARVATFRTWLCVGDDQVLISLDDGRIFSIDHGDCFGGMPVAAIQRVISPSIPNVPDD